MKARVGAALLLGLGYLAQARGVLAQECERLRCEGDADRDGAVTVEEIVTSVNRAISGCSGCADVSGTWDLVASNLPEDPPFRYEIEVTFVQQDDCSVEGTFRNLVSGGSAGDVSVLTGSLNGQTITLRRLLSREQMYDGTVELGENTMAGTWGRVGNPSRVGWSATRRPPEASCAAVSGVWDVLQTGSSSTFEMEVNLAQHDDCSVDGTFENLNGSNVGLVTALGCFVSGRSIVWRRALSPQQVFEGKLVLGDNTIAGTYTAGSSAPLPWNATRRPVSDAHFGATDQ